MSRWGGFKNGKSKYSSQWSEMRSSSSDRQNSAASSPNQFSYVEGKGIWNLRSTTEFPQSNSLIFDLTFISHTSNATSFNVPVTAQAGDLAIFYTTEHGENITGTYSPPTGFTQIRQDVDAADSAMITAYKILDASDMNRSLTGIVTSGGIGMNGLLLFRPRTAIASINPFIVNGQATISDPSAQTLSLSIVPGSKAILAMAFMSSTTLSALNTSISVPMEEFAPNVSTRIYYKLYVNPTSVDTITVDMTDQGDNVMQSWALAIS